MLKIGVVELPTLVSRAVATFGTPATGGLARVMSVTTRLGCPHATAAVILERISSRTELDRRIFKSPWFRDPEPEGGSGFSVLES
jgi:hypothetical protein